MEKEITVTSDDPTHTIMMLRVKANIVGSIEILPRAYLSMPSPPNMEYNGKLLVRKEKTETGELNITEATAGVPWISVKARKVEKAEPPTAELPAAEPGDFVVEVSVTDDAAIVQSGQQIRFKTGLPREPQTMIPLSVAAQQALTAVPSALVLQALDGVKESTGTFEVSVRQSLANQPVTAAISPQNFGVKLEPDGPKHYKATVSWKATGEIGEKMGVVTLTVSGESIRVPLRVRDKPLPPVPPAITPTSAPAPDAPGAPAPAAGQPPLHRGAPGARTPSPTPGGATPSGTAPGTTPGGAAPGTTPGGADPGAPAPSQKP